LRRRVSTAQTLFRKSVFVILPQAGADPFIIAVNALLGTFQVFDLPWLLSKSGFVEGQGGAGGRIAFPGYAGSFDRLRLAAFRASRGHFSGLLVLIVAATMIMFGLRRLSRRNDV